MATLEDEGAPFPAVAKMDENVLIVMLLLLLHVKECLSAMFGVIFVHSSSTVELRTQLQTDYDVRKLEVMKYWPTCFCVVCLPVKVVRSQW